MKLNNKKILLGFLLQPCHLVLSCHPCKFWGNSKRYYSTEREASFWGSWYFRRAFSADLGHERHKYIDVNWLFLNKSSSLNKSDEPFLDFRDFLETCTIHFKIHELDVTARILHCMSLGLLKLNFDLEWDLINVPAFSASVNYRSFKRPDCHYFNITAHIDSTLADTLISEQILQKSKVTFEEIFTLRCPTRRETSWSMIPDWLLKWSFHVHSFETRQQRLRKARPVRVSSEQISDFVHLHTYVKQNKQTIIISERHRRTVKKTTSTFYFSTERILRNSFLTLTDDFFIFTTMKIISICGTSFHPWGFSWPKRNRQLW